MDIEQYVSMVLRRAVNERASDIHFEPFEDSYQIRYRLDGLLNDIAAPPALLASSIASCLKAMAGLDIAERRLPQDGRFQQYVADKYVDFRISTLPTQHGESVVIRILDKQALHIDLGQLGMAEDVYQAFDEDIHQLTGLMIITGPTGSGKTTTLYSALSRINTEAIKVITAEDPVEYELAGVGQVEVGAQEGVGFARLLRAFLRHDPDVIMIGEIRDAEAAKMAFQAALTGHLVFSTLHTNDAASAITRLLDLHIEPFLITSALRSVLAQRLVRLICKQCRQSASGTPGTYYGVGCPQCQMTGYRGRRGIFEYLRLSSAFWENLDFESPAALIKERAVALGMRTLQDEAARFIAEGLTTREEIWRL